MTETSDPTVPTTKRRSAFRVLDPAVSAVVRAAAGTGKTRLLTSRIVRLLLAGAEPGSILAISFTRKAAAEIRERVIRQLMDLAAADEPRLNFLLTEIGAPTDPETKAAARRLYERILTSVHELRASTFHAFCQELLHRFPLEAGIAPAFEVYEASGELETAAWRELDRELLREPDGLVAQNMDRLFQRCGGLGNARAALLAFLEHRSDWWAYVQQHPDPAAYAGKHLQEFLNTVLSANPIAEFFADAEVTDALTRYAASLPENSLRTHQALKTAIEQALNPATTPEAALRLIAKEFLTRDGRTRKFRAGKILESKIGAAGLEEVRRLHGLIAARAQAALDGARRLGLLELSHSWYVCGQRLLFHYQRLKRERGVLDFADLEWNAYGLLNTGRHAEWIQYKLDRRIDHVLIDEFQDTNPTQWRLLNPLLREIAAGDPERRRSVFVVGDEKQSIYRFRRANPELFQVATNWLVHNMQADVVEQNVSRRSSPAIIQFLNLVFGSPPVDETRTSADCGKFSLPDFRPHDAGHKNRWGLVELQPLIVETNAPAQDSTLAPSTDRVSLRNPLEQPRAVEEDMRYRQEGAVIAAKIREIVGAIEIERDDGTAQPLEYSDCLILLRDRTYASAYEEALRRAGIPYVGIGRGGFAGHLEIRDLINLLTFLVSPGDDLALAAVLRSPIFAATDEHLMRLAAMSSPSMWFERLLAIEPPDADLNAALARAAHLLRHWRALVDHVPVHDLLDRIFSEGDVVGRYLSAVVPHLRPRVAANLKRFLELALEADGGRYPGISRFLSRLKVLTVNENDTPDYIDSGANFVRVMTIHAAKGLEASAVFLADAARESGGRVSAQRPLVDWPAQAEQPRLICLLGRNRELDETSRALLRQDQSEAQREESNLLYVALTRARQLLFISGCKPRRGGRGWYGFIEERLRDALARKRAEAITVRVAQSESAGDGENATIAIEHGVRPTAPMPHSFQKTPPPAIDPGLMRPLTDLSSRADSGPGRSVGPTDSPSNLESAPESAPHGDRDRGNLIHEILSRLNGTDSRASIKSRLRRAWVPALDDITFEAGWAEACGVVDNIEFAELFNAARHEFSRNEVSILYRSENGRNLYGRIDRVVVTKRDAIVVEYKTLANATADNAPELARPYYWQLRAYAEGIRKIWTNKRVRALVLFTRCAVSVEVDLDG